MTEGIEEITCDLCYMAGFMVENDDGTLRCSYCYPNGLTCIREAAGDCDGEVDHRMNFSGSGSSQPLCDNHWYQRVEREQEIRQRYPHHQPAGFDPMYAGESWDGE